MFEDMGLSPETAAGWTALTVECRPLLEGEGMDAVQALLASRGTSAIQAVVITRELLGRERTPLRTAIEIVGSSAARAAAL